MIVFPCCALVLSLSKFVSYSFVTLRFLPLSSLSLSLVFSIPLLSCCVTPGRKGDSRLIESTARENNKAQATQRSTTRLLNRLFFIIIVSFSFFFNSVFFSCFPQCVVENREHERTRSHGKTKAYECNSRS